MSTVPMPTKLGEARIYVSHKKGGEVFATLAELKAWHDTHLVQGVEGVLYWCVDESSEKRFVRYNKDVYIDDNGTRVCISALGRQSIADILTVIKWRRARLHRRRRLQLLHRRRPSAMVRRL